MNINSIQGANAYTTSTPLENTTPAQTQDRQVAEPDPNRENTRPDQEAFQVTITQEARTRQAAQLETTAQPVEPSEPPEPPEENRQATPVVDIVA